MNQEGAFFSPVKRKSFCSRGCSHHGYRDCVSTQTEDTGYYPWLEPFYCKMKFLWRKALILWKQQRPTTAARLVNLLNVRVGKLETLKDWAGRQKKHWSQEDVRRMTRSDSDTCVSPCSTLKHQDRTKSTITTTATPVQSQRKVLKTY